MTKTSSIEIAAKETEKIGGVLDENHENEEINDIEIQTETQNHIIDDTSTEGADENKIKTKGDGFGGERKAEYVSILLTKTQRVKDDEDQGDIEEDIITYVGWIVSRWMSRKNIKEVRSIQGNESVTDLEDWNR